MVIQGGSTTPMILSGIMSSHRDGTEEVVMSQDSVTNNDVLPESQSKAIESETDMPDEVEPTKENDAVVRVAEPPHDGAHLDRDIPKPNSQPQAERVFQKTGLSKFEPAGTEPSPELDQKITLQVGVDVKIENAHDPPEVEGALNRINSDTDSTPNSRGHVAESHQPESTDVVRSQSPSSSGLLSAQQSAAAPITIKSSPSVPVLNAKATSESPSGDLSSIEATVHQAQEDKRAGLVLQPTTRKAALKAQKQLNVDEILDGEDEDEDDKEQDKDDGDYIDGDSSVRPARRTSVRNKVPSIKKRNSTQADLDNRATSEKKTRITEKKGATKVESLKSNGMKPKEIASKAPQINVKNSTQAPGKANPVPNKGVASKLLSKPVSATPFQLPPNEMEKKTSTMTGQTNPKTATDAGALHIIDFPKDSIEYPKAFKCKCNARIQKSFADFNVPDDEVATQISDLIGTTEDYFAKAVSSPEKQQQLANNIQAYCRNLTTQLPGATSLLLWGDRSGPPEEAYSKLMVCLNPSSGFSAPEAWEILHSLFWAFVTEKVLMDGKLLGKIGLDDLENAHAVQNYHQYLDETDPRVAKVHRIGWRQYLANRLQSPSVAKKVTYLSTSLGKEFFEGMVSFSSCDNPRFGGSVEKMLTTSLEGTINLRARLMLSSFRYKFSWVKTGSKFDSRWMQTERKPRNDIPTHLNRVRFAKSPLIQVQRPKGDNKTGLEAAEIPNEDYGSFIVLELAQVLCFDGRIADQPGDQGA